MAGLQKKTINKYLRQRVRSWVKNINDPAALVGILDNASDPEVLQAFQDQIFSSVIVSGGCIASHLLGEEVNDIDVYFSNKEIARKVAQYYLNLLINDSTLAASQYISRREVRDNNTGGVAIYIGSQGVSGDGIESKNYNYFESLDSNTVDEFFSEYKKNKGGKTQVVFMSSNAISLASGIQIILRFTGSVDEIHKNFDFVHATNYWSSETGVVYNDRALQALLERRLYYVGSLYPVASMFRLRKFIQRGYKISAGEMCKIAYDISKLELDDVYVLRDQLMGCDLAYFSEVISILQKQSTKEIDRTYLFAIIDRVFGDEELGTDEQTTNESPSEDPRDG